MIDPNTREKVVFQAGDEIGVKIKMLFCDKSSFEISIFKGLVNLLFPNGDKVRIIEGTRAIAHDTVALMADLFNLRYWESPCPEDQSEFFYKLSKR